MPYTLTEAYTRIQSDLLDDSGGVRFPSARVHRALRAAAASCFRDLANESVGAYLTYEDHTTSASGTLALSTFTTPVGRVSKIVQRLNGGWSQAAVEISPNDHGIDLTEPIDLRVHFYPAYEIPGVADGSRYLVGGGVAAVDIDTDDLDDWICHVAACSLRRLDKSGKEDTVLFRERDRLRQTIVEAPAAGRSTARRRNRRTSYTHTLRYHLKQRTLVFSK